MDNHIIEHLVKITGEDNCLINEPMSRHTTFKTGGPAAVFLMPDSTEKLADIIKYCKDNNVDHYILGNGSNLLVSDRGYDGVVIRILDNMNEIRIEGTSVYAQAGALLSRIGRTALDAGLTGFEFASGIPGSAGGACIMNAGAYGGEIKDIIKYAKAVTADGEIVTVNRDEMELGYRSSVFAHNSMVVTEVCFELASGDKEEITARMKELAQKRRDKQPLEYPSAGSTFKRPEGYFAGKLIMEAGLRGYSVGGAQVSEKHCGFVINKGEATSDDIYALIQDVIAKVKESAGVTLEPEVRLLGNFSLT